MKKSIAGLCAVVVALAIVITAIIIGVFSDDEAADVFKEEFTETILVEGGVAMPEQIEKEFVIEEEGNYVFYGAWELSEPGLLTGCTIMSMDGEMIFASTADSCTMESDLLKMEEGTYTLTLQFLASEEQWYAFIINMSKWFDDWDIQDTEYDFATEGEFTIPFNFEIEKQSAEFVIGFIIGLTLVFAITALITILIMKLTKTDGAVKCKYDERQELVRGRGFKYAFFTIMIYNFAVAYIQVCSVNLPADSSALLMIGAILGLLVYVIYAIWNEAYFSLNENPKKVMIILSFIGLMNLVIGIVQMIEGRFLENGVLTYTSMNFILGVVFVIIFIVITAKQICNKREEE